ncbi:hypothetical protein V8F33_006512 [Rhypophila sp. PSN 637]
MSTSFGYSLLNPMIEIIIAYPAAHHRRLISSSSAQPLLRRPDDWRILSAEKKIQWLLQQQDNTRGTKDAKWGWVVYRTAPRSYDNPWDDPRGLQDLAWRSLRTWYLQDPKNWEDWDLSASPEVAARLDWVFVDQPESALVNSSMQDFKEGFRKWGACRGR